MVFSKCVTIEYSFGCIFLKIIQHFLHLLASFLDPFSSLQQTLQEYNTYQIGSYPERQWFQSQTSAWKEFLMATRQQL